MCSCLKLNLLRDDGDSGGEKSLGRVPKHSAGSAFLEGLS